MHVARQSDVPRIAGNHLHADRRWIDRGRRARERLASLREQEAGLPVIMLAGVTEFGAAAYVPCEDRAQTRWFHWDKRVAVDAERISGQAAVR